MSGALRRLDPAMGIASGPPDVNRGARSVDRVNHLRTVDLFDGLAEAELHEVERSSPVVRADAGRLLYAPGASDEALWILKQGAVRLYRLSTDGREVSLGTLGPGDVFGTMPLFGSFGRLTFAEAAEPSVVCRMDEHRLESLVSRHPQVAIRLLRLVGERMAVLEDLLEDLAFRSAEQRVARAVLRMRDERRSDRLVVSHEQVAKAAGVARETATKIIGTLERAGVVETGYRRMRIVDASGLASRAGD